MFRFLVILSALPIITAFLLRWWLGIRILSTTGKRQCSCNLTKWEETFGKDSTPPSASADARVHAEFLHKAALSDWKTREPKAAATREAVRRFGMAVPPLTAMVMILPIIIMKISPLLAIAFFLLAIALAATFAYLGLAPELRAIALTSRRLRDSRIYPRREDEDAVVQATTALAWKQAAPPIFNLIQR
ncbi:MAG: hypothetical protein NWT08_06550 [Akkermansiaceae bacterium]|nr:hypothetical protein [Akkermansiaceae bacterium]MDP4647777.1 hypothetical protein [Akkermansiaceae bacterium]MDP4780852.1 hypothetical protein [Akkermansiaceae bacterium]MDP4848426.1 hypothetical protein [Akkermansiaceae bacterium]MDP4896822.1 hypothetical protein [Akkermansiaceae bacterium]